MKEGTERMTTETGAGQWGSALSLACNYFDMECKVYMVRSSFYQKPYRKSMMTLWGANVVPSPSPETAFGRKVLEEQPDTPGSLGIAVPRSGVPPTGSHHSHNRDCGSYRGKHRMRAQVLVLPVALQNIRKIGRAHV